jgi:hypothetical protein
MFSDVLFDAYHGILEAIDKEYSYIEIYPPRDVIKMLAHIRYVTMLSDCRMLDGSFSKSLEEMRKISFREAKKDYYRQMNKNKNA